MKEGKSTHFYMRLIHRYLGFFLAGIMSVYAISGVLLIFRDTDYFKITQVIENKTSPNLKQEELGRKLKIKRLKVTKEEQDIMYFDGGMYNKETGQANYTIKELPFGLKKLTKLHKATTKSPLYWLNIFFGMSLMFFSVSAFFMYLPSNKIFRKGLYFTIGGVLLTLILIYI